MKKYIQVVLLLCSQLAFATTSNLTTGNRKDVINERVASEVREPKLAIKTSPVIAAIFNEGFESGLGEWLTSYTTSSGSFTLRNWVLSSSSQAEHAGTVAFGVDFQGGDCMDELENGIISITSPVISIPVGPASNYYLAFDHYYNSEYQLDGGNVKYSLNGGPWLIVPKTAFQSNGYNTFLISSEGGSDNPMAGQEVFSGASDTWSKSVVHLNKLGLDASKTIQFKWDMGTDGCNGVEGWYIDNIDVTSEVIPIPPAQPKVHFVLTEATIDEGDAINGPDGCNNYVDYLVTVKIDKASSAPATLLFAPTGYYEDDLDVPSEGGPGNDYTFFPKKVVLQSGELTKDITIRVYNDGYAENDEQIRLGFTISTLGDAFGDGVFVLNIKDDDHDKGYVVDDIFVENFDSPTLPSNWVADEPENYTKWGVDFFGQEAPTPNNWGLYIRFIEVRGENLSVDQKIESPWFNSLGYSEVKLSFSHILQLGGDEATPIAEVQVWSGTAWHKVWEKNNGTAGYPFTVENAEILIPANLVNANMKIRFRFLTYLDGSWQIDNIKITGTNYSIPIANAVSINPDKQYLGPNQTVYFYDTESKAILAKIKNLTGHDYGCTSVEIDRAGDGTSEWNGYSISNKTLRVIPSNPDPAGKYEITLYYTAAELGDFKSSITSMGKSEGGIGVGDASSSTAVPVTVAKYNDDFAFTAIFETGFSGFGLSDAPSGTSLPVKLLSFEGKHTVEGNMLNWVTTEEVNNDYFAVERSYNAKKFMEIGRVPALTALSSSHNYYFTDNDFTSGKSYYRLKQVDKDGKYAYSEIVAIQNKAETNVIVYPNPTKGLIKFKIGEDGNGIADLRVMDHAGKVLQKISAVTFENGVLESNMAGFPIGIYQIIITTRKGKYLYKVVRQ